MIDEQGSRTWDRLARPLTANHGAIGMAPTPLVGLAVNVRPSQRLSPTRMIVNKADGPKGL